MVKKTVGAKHILQPGNLLKNGNSVNNMQLDERNVFDFIQIAIAKPAHGNVLPFPGDKVIV